jgi:hypothetical protein
MIEGGKERLTTLLNYLIKHNEEHSAELIELAEKAKTAANDVVRDDILEAARLMDASTESLKLAFMELSKD